jgi:hypothetical protein
MQMPTGSGAGCLAAPTTGLNPAAFDTRSLMPFSSVASSSSSDGRPVVPSPASSFALVASAFCRLLASSSPAISATATIQLSTVSGGQPMRSSTPASAMQNVSRLPSAA